MSNAKKTIILVISLILLALLFTVPASAVKPDHVTGYVPLLSLFETEENLEFDICDPYIVGHAVQPLETPGKAVHGVVFVGPDIEVENCDYSVAYPDSGTCEYLLLPVEEFGNPDSKEGKATLLKCTGVLTGLHATYQIHYDFTYDARYHGHP